MKLSKAVVVGLVLASQTVFANHDRDGGGSIGSGSDALFDAQTSSPPWSGDVEAPLPPDLMNYGTLIVNGDPSPGQPKASIVARRCEKGEGDLPKPDTCESYVFAKLNEPMSLLAGSYLVAYNPGNDAGFDYYGSSYAPGLIDIEAGGVVTLQIRKIKVPQSPVPMTYRVFEDLTDAKTLARYNSYRSHSSTLKSKLAYLEELREKYPQCAVTLSRDLGWLVANSSVVSDKEANRTQYGLQPKDCSIVPTFPKLRSYLSESQDGGFVNVFPGVYGIEFTNQYGTSSSQYGVRVTE